MHPDLSLMPLHELFANSQPDAASRAISSVKPFKGCKHAALKLERYSHTVVRARKQPFIVMLRGTDVNPRGIRSSVVDRIADEILKYLEKACFMCPDEWHRIVCDSRARFLRFTPQILDCHLKWKSCIDEFVPFRRVLRESGVTQHIFNQAVHPPRGSLDKV